MIAKQSFWVARCDWEYSRDGQIHSHVELESPTQSYFLKMPEFRKWFFELWKNDELHTACEDENQIRGFSKSGFRNSHYIDNSDSTKIAIRKSFKVDVIFCSARDQVTTTEPTEMS